MKKRLIVLVILLVISLLLINSVAAEEFTIYHKYAFDWILPDTHVSADEEISELIIRSTPGEEEPVTFVIYANENLEDVTVNKEDFHNLADGSSITKDNIDVRLVKVWDVSSHGTFDEEEQQIPMLLMYDDSEELIFNWNINSELIKTGYPDGQGIEFSDTNMINRYPIEDNINQIRGTIDLWLKPTWNKEDISKTREFFRLDPGIGKLLLQRTINSQNEPYFSLIYEHVGITQVRIKDDFSQADQWMRITASWDFEEEKMDIYINGLKQGNYQFFNNIEDQKPKWSDYDHPNEPFKISQSYNFFYLGGVIGSKSIHGQRGTPWLNPNLVPTSYPAEAVIDKVKIYDYYAEEAEIESESFNHNPIFSEDYEDLQNLNGELRIWDYAPPIISKQLKTNIPQNTVKQFWVTIKVPEDTASGEYQSSLTIQAKDKTAKTLNLNLEVLPFTLSAPQQQYLMHFHAQLPDDTRLQKQIEDVCDAGFNGAILSITGDHTQEIDRFLEKGGTCFTGPIVVGTKRLDSQNLLQESFDLLEEYNYEKVAYGVDEPFTNELLDQHKIESIRIHQLGGKVTTAIDKSTTSQLIGEEELDYPQYSMGVNPIKNIFNDDKPLGDPGIDNQLYDYIESIRGDINNKDNENEYYYWQSGVDIKLHNRLLTGFFLWTSKLDGAAPHFYQYYPAWTNNPASYMKDPYRLNEYFVCHKNKEESKANGIAATLETLSYHWTLQDCQNDCNGIGGCTRVKKQATTTYPSQHGPVPSLKWVELKEGIDDVKYLTTLYNLIEEIEHFNQELVNSIKQEIENNLIKYQRPRDLDGLSGKDFQDTRDLIIQLILQAQEEITNNQQPDIEEITDDQQSESSFISFMRNFEEEYGKEKLKQQMENNNWNDELVISLTSWLKNLFSNS